MAKSPKKLDEEVQAFIVKQLACYMTPTQVVRLVMDEFGTEVKRQDVRRYNPEQSTELAQKWIDLFNTTRKRFLDDISEIPIANQHVRLQHLQYNLERAGDNIILRNQILEQIAKEMGGVFTNKRHLTIDPREALAKFLGCKPDDLPANSPHA